MDNGQHVCKCSPICQDILNSLVTFSLTPFLPLNPGSIGSVSNKYSFKFLYCSIILTSTLSRLSQRVWHWFITYCVSRLLTQTHLYNLLFSLQVVWKRNTGTSLLQTDQHLHYPRTSKKCVATLFWSSLASFDLNNLLTLGPSIPKASNKLRSNLRSLTNSKKSSTRSSAVQWPTNREPQYDVTILRKFFEKKLAYPSYCFFTWAVGVSLNLKEYGDFCTSVISSLSTKGVT